jgi:flagellin-specific chaperone FliS
MGHSAGYANYQAISLDGEAAYEELYTRLARWTREAAVFQQDARVAEAEAKIDRCIEVLGYMDRGIDMSQNYDIALAVRSLHRFAIAALVKAKGDRDTAELEPLAKVFFSLAEIFTAIRGNRSKPVA